MSRRPHLWKMFGTIGIAIITVLWLGRDTDAQNPAEPNTLSQQRAEETVAETPPAPAALRFDFETGDLQGWQVVEGKFSRLVNDRKMFRNRPTVEFNKQGQFFLDTYEQGGDPQTGVVVSPVFILTGPELSFLVGGGGHTDTYVALCTNEGTEVLKASGLTDELLQRVQWDATAYLGRRVFLKLVDGNTGPWGHVTFDDFQAAGQIDQQVSEENFARWRQQQRQQLPVLAEQKKALEQARVERVKELLSDQVLFNRGSSRVYKAEHLGAIDFTVGGIGAGCIRLDGKARRHVWQIFNNSTQALVPHSFFAVWANPGAPGQAAVRAMQTEAVGPFGAMEKLSFRGEYPFAWFDFEDTNLAVAVGMEVFNPLIPLDTKSSAMPCAVFNLSATNNSGRSVDVSFLAVQQNAVGFTGQGDINGKLFAGYGGNTNTIIRRDPAVVLNMTASKLPSAPGYGDMALAALTTRGVLRRENITVAADFDSLETLRADFAEDGELTGPTAAGPSPEGKTVDGALAVKFNLNPGQSKTTTFILTWYFPNAMQGGVEQWLYHGNMYSNWWKNASDVLGQVTGNLEQLSALTKLYHDTLYESNLPYWLLDRLSSQLAILRSRTCFWSKDGYFGGWEGCGRRAGCCHGNCTHVWQYAQAHARLFPELARLMRQQSFGCQQLQGALPFRHPVHPPAFDGQCGEVLSAYREHLCSPGAQWLGTIWPSVKKAMEYTISQWDADEDGVLTGPQHNTLDDNLGGNSSWLGSMYAAALAAAEKMAALEGERETASRYQRIWQSAVKKHDESLWNGEYYFQIPDPQAYRDYGQGCHIDQLLGQWWANQLNIGWFYPQQRVRSAMLSLLRYNFKPDFHGITQVPRKFVADDDPGMQMITWPKGGRPESEHCTFYADEVMTGFEYAAATTMLQAGLLKEAFAVVKAVADRYDGRLRTGLSNPDHASWGYSGNPFGDDECGKFYARAMSVWSILLACQGYIYDGPAGIVGFMPLWKPDDHCSFFTAAEGWGLFRQRRTDRTQTDTIQVKNGSLRLKELQVALPAPAIPASVGLLLDGRKVQTSFSFQGQQLRVAVARPVVLKAGSSLTLQVNY